MSTGMFCQKEKKIKIKLTWYKRCMQKMPMSIFVFLLLFSKKFKKRIYGKKQESKCHGIVWAGSSATILSHQRWKEAYIKLTYPMQGVPIKNSKPAYKCLNKIAITNSVKCEQYAKIIGRFDTSSTNMLYMCVQSMCNTRVDGYINKTNFSFSNNIIHRIKNQPKNQI